MVVDDHHINRRVTHEMLAAAGCVLAVAGAAIRGAAAGLASAGVAGVNTWSLSVTARLRRGVVIEDSVEAAGRTGFSTHIAAGQVQAMFHRADRPMT